MRTRRELVLGSGAALFVLLIVAGAWAMVVRSQKTAALSTARLAAVQAALTDSRAEAKSKDRYIVEITRTIDEVHSELATLIPAELAVERTWVDVEKRPFHSPTRREELLKDLNKLSSEFAAQRSRLDALQTRLRQTSVRMKGLESVVERLRVSLSAREQRIAELHGKLDQASRRVKGLERQLTSRDRTIADKNIEIAQRDEVIDDSARRIQQLDEERHRAYVAVGTIHELEKLGIVMIGKTRFLRRDVPKLTGSHDPDRFRAVDTREEFLELPFPLARLQVLTAQPVGSFQLVGAGPAVTRLVVRDARFWETSRYVVVLVK